MHNIFAGILGFFLSIGSIFHGGANPPVSNVPQIPRTNVSGTPAAAGNGGYGFGQGRNLPQGERPFFGTVTGVSGSTLTIQTQGRRGPNGSTPAATPGSPQTLTVNLDSATTYSGGVQSDIAANTRIAGVGRTNSDGSITAVSIQINPTMPTGSPRGQGRMGNIPAGSQPIFGQVTAISGTQLTIQRQGRNGNGGTTVIVNLTGTTQYTGGAQTDIQSGIRIGGYGTLNSDGSINAQQIMINPTMPNRGQNPNQNTGQ